MVPTVALAATFQAPDTDSFSLSVPVVDDLYLVGGSLTIDERVSEDLIIAGGDIVVRESIGQDLVAAGGRLVIQGRVGDDVRITGGDVRIEGDVGDDVIIGAGEVVISKDSTIRGDLIVAGGEVIVDGDVLGSAQVRGGRVVINGSIQKDADIRGGDVTTNGSILGDALVAPGERWSMGEDFSIRGNLTYWHPDGAQPMGKVVRGDAVFDPDLGPFIADHEDTISGVIKGFLFGLMGYSVLSAALLMLIVVLATKKSLPAVARKISKAKWKCTALGLAYIAMLPLVALLFMGTVVGLPIGLLLIIIYGFHLFFALPFTALIVTKWFELKRKYKWNKPTYFFACVGAYILIKSLAFVPVVGWIAVFLLVCTAFGAGIMAKWEALEKIR